MSALQYVTAVSVFAMVPLICQVSSNRLKLMPLSLQKKLCEKNPLLKICASVQNYVFDAATELQKDGFSEWDICDIRPDLGFCSQRKTVIAPPELDAPKLTTTSETISEMELESSGESLEPESNNLQSYFSTEIQPLDM